jgi:hypothetical protein
LLGVAAHELRVQTTQSVLSKDSQSSVINRKHGAPLWPLIGLCCLTRAAPLQFLFCVPTNPVPSDCCLTLCSILMRGHHAWLNINPLSLLKLLGCNLISVASFTSLSINPALLASTVASLKPILCPVSVQHYATADFSGWWSHMWCSCTLHMAVTVYCLAYIHLTILTRNTVNAQHVTS